MSSTDLPADGAGADAVSTTGVPAGLTAAEVAHYRQEGFVVRRGLFSAGELAAWDARFLDYIEGRLPRCEGLQVMRDVMVVKGAVDPRSAVHAVNKLFCFEADPVLMGYTTSPAMLACVRDLVGPRVHSVSTNVFNKPPEVDGRHPMHQDLRYFRARPADLIVGTWTAVYPAVRETGCLSVLPRSHLEGPREHVLPDWAYVNHGFFAVRDVDTSGRVHVELQPGDTLFFHPLLIHGSGHNRSTRFRRAISAHYISDEARAPDGREWRDKPTVRRMPEAPAVL